MDNQRISLVLSASFLEFASDIYDWATKSEREFYELSERQRREIRLLHRGATYRDRAVCLVNQAFKDERRENDLDSIEWVDLKRSYLLQHQERPDDLLGLTYHWFHGHVNLYIPGLSVKPHRCFKNADGPNDIKECLYHSFLDWAETHDCLDKLNPSAVQNAYIDEIHATFMVVLEHLTGNNSYFQRIFEPSSEESNVSLDEAFTEISTASERAHAYVQDKQK